jgi:hypothetical protein
VLERVLREPRRVAAATLVALTVLLVAVEVVPGFDRVHDAAARNEGFTAQERRLVSAYGVDISREFLSAALRLLPPDATYAVVTGPNVQVSTPITLSALAPYAQSLLLPRRQRPFFDSETEYVLCYGCDLAEQEAGGPIQVLWDGEPGLAIARRTG